MNEMGVSNMISQILALDNYVVLGTVLTMFFFFIMLLLISFDAFSKRSIGIRPKGFGNHFSSASCFDFKNSNVTDENHEAPELMFYRASHDLKSPLKSIMGLVQLGLKDENPENQRIYLQKINETASGLEGFISEILDLGKIKRKKVQLKPVDLRKLIDDCIHSFSSYPERKNVKFRFEYEPHLMVVSDENLLRSVILNLIENGIKYRDKNKRSSITISAYHHNENININFLDNGIGVSSENLPYVFDLFYRVDSKIEGSGLGLYIVKESVKRLRSCIKAYSEYGKGSLFILEIPVKKEVNDTGSELTRGTIDQRLN